MTDPIEQFFSRLHHPSLAQIDLKLDRMLRLLSLLGNPHKRIPPVIHVAGTNGKGSLIAYLKAIFEAAGLRVHVYTSPHLVQFRERIVVAGTMIENAQIESIIRHVAPILAQQPATFFEATTALAFLAFAEKKADVVLLETGMGGRLDCTNVIDKPILTAITPIALDHMEFLGDTVTKIAAEKAGIIKQNVGCVLGRQTPEALAVLRAKAGEKNAPLIEFTERELPAMPSLVGAHQRDNAMTAMACIEQLPQFNITQEHIAEGLASAVWPARLQKLTRGPYAEMLPSTMQLWLDGGHNQQGGEVLAAWLAEQNKPVYAICGMMGTKDASGYLQAIAPYVSKLYAVAIPNEATCKKPSEIVASAQAAGIKAEAAESVEAALAAIVSSPHPNPPPQAGEGNNNQSALVAIIGSLYLAGFVLQKHG